MAVDGKTRVMWLLNHTTLRKFELGQLAALGINEVFTPKNFPYDEGNLSASVDYSTDSTLTIPSHSLQILNQENWYENPSAKAWEIANNYFDIVIIGFFPQQIKATIRNFRGVIILRAFGLAAGFSYTQLLKKWFSTGEFLRLQKIYNRFWFGADYEHLRDNETGILFERFCFLPVGLQQAEVSRAKWTGEQRKIFFVCPRIGTSPYYRAVYDSFKRNFSGFEYVIGGAQPVPVNDHNVIGFVPKEIHEQNMQRLRVMFYHSTEQNHIHYHPFEAIQFGMPLIFMAGGMLDRLGGKELPGRCKSVKEARRKIRRIMQDDWNFIEKVRRSQVCLLESMNFEKCATYWRENFKQVLDSLKSIDNSSSVKAVSHSNRKPRIAVILPIGYRGGTLRGAKMLAEEIELGSKQAGEPVDVVFAHLDDPSLYTSEDFADLPPSIQRRPFRWRILDAQEARRAMAYAGIDIPLTDFLYQVPDDGIMQFYDCDLWVVVSDRLQHCLLPVRPYVLMVYNYLQRYVPCLPSGLNQQFIKVAHAAEKVLVTTEFTRQDAIQYAGIPADRVVKVPILAPIWNKESSFILPSDENLDAYFLWTTNLALHKNHVNAFKALAIYYEKYGGRLKCHISGFGSNEILRSDLPHLRSVSSIYEKSRFLQSCIRIKGELSENAYRAQLAGAAFLWHPCLIDSGTFSVVEAASLGVPALSSDYPAMREISAQFGLNLCWMDPHNPDHMGRQLKEMEIMHNKLRVLLQQKKEKLFTQTLENWAPAYWEAIKTCL
ncbi:MAG: glycosyltransferase [Desulfurispora sp.]|uniref:glycosyltransferase n=1 Tax=Desulfurispora sp. TaxID=3014275 RepID=UPI00404B176E